MSDSESSSSGSSGSGSVEARKAADSDARSAGSSSKNVSRGGNEPFAPPPRFTAVSFGENVGPFEHDSLRKGSGKELWAVRIPEGVPPSELDGLKIKVPPSSSKPSREPLGSIKLGGSGPSERTYLLQISSPFASNTVTSGDPARRRAAAEESQLIAMAQDGVQRLKTQRSKEEEERRIAAAGALEMEGFKALLPKKEAGGKGQGRLAFSSTPITRHLHLSLAAPVAPGALPTPPPEETSADSQKAGGVKRKREQPWEKLKGVFHPAGASGELKTETAPADERGPSSSPKKARKSESGHSGKDKSRSKKEKEKEEEAQKSPKKKSRA